MTPIHFLGLLLYGFAMCAIGVYVALRSVYWESGTPTNTFTSEGRHFRERGRPS